MPVVHVLRDLLESLAREIVVDSGYRKDIVLIREHKAAFENLGFS